MKSGPADASRMPEPFPVPVVEVPATDAPYRIEGGVVYAQDRAHLPERCLLCGDTVGLTRLQTLPGHVHYHICREHLIAAIAKLVAGVVATVIGFWSLYTAIVENQYVGFLSQAFFVVVMLAGLAAMAWAVPLHAGKSRNGWRRLWFLGELKNI